MKKEISAGLIAFVAITSIAIFTVTSSMSTSFEIDGKRTSNELELLFLGSGDDEYQEYKYVSEKFEKSMIYASAGGAEVYEAGWLPEFLEKMIDKLFEFLSGTDPKELGEDLYEKVDEEYPHYDEAGEPGSTPVAGAVEEEWAGPMELIIDGKLSENEQSMLEATAGKIEFEDGGSRYYTATGGVVPGAKCSIIAFLGNDLYFYEEVDPKFSVDRPDVIGEITIKPRGGEYPRMICDLDEGRESYLIKTKKEHANGTKFLDPSRKFKTKGLQSGNKIEYVVRDLYPVIKKYIGDNVKIETLGGTAKLKLSDIRIDDVLID